MTQFPFRPALIALTLGLTLSGCAYDRYGRHGGYGAVEVGLAGDPYWGWYGDYYYPGAGYYVYDHHRRPIRWNDEQQHYWTGRQAGWHDRDSRPMRANWHDFRRDRRG